MKNESSVTLHDVYEIVGRVETKLDKIDTRVSVLEIWKAEIMGKIAIVTGVFILGFNFVWEFLKTKLFKDL